MESLPEELLINIFSYIHPQDLISTSFTCKIFSDVINSSNKLINQLTIKFTTETANYEWIGSRNYTNVMITEGGIGKYLDVYGNFGDSVKKLTINCKDLKLLELIDILKQCRNLKELELTEKSTEDAIIDIDQLPSLKLDKLKIHGGLKALQILENCQTKELHVCWRPRAYPSECKLADFLVTQKNLKTLKLENFSEYSFELPQNMIDKFQFKLKKLSIRNCSDLYILKLKNFFDLHVNTLEYLELDSYGHRESKLLHPFKKLKSLKFNAECLKIHAPLSPSDMIFSILSGANQFPDPFYFEIRPLHQIKILKVFNIDSDILHFSHYFPNVEELNLEGKNSSFLVNVENFERIRVLEIYSKKLTKAIKIPKTLEKLKLFVDGFPKNQAPFADYYDNKIEELTFGRKCDLNLIKSFVLNGCEKLKVFKTFNKKIDHELRELLITSTNAKIIEY